ncbi:MAG: arylsulfatase [Bacteroidota bacterium]
MKKITLILFLCCTILFSCSTVVQESSKQPNILLIMADDMGYSDIGCYGGEINTPNLDKLANEGLRFTQFYNGARCCPTRATLLTGLSPHLAGMGGMVGGRPADSSHAYQGYLNEQCVTLAEVLRPAGYRNYMVGKWHVGEFKPVFPLDRGFDRYYGLISGAMNYWNISKGKRKNIHRQFVEDTTNINSQIQGGFYSTTAYSQKAVDYLNGHFDNHTDQPFFMYLAHQAPHWPLHAPDTVIAKYRGKYLQGWAQLREERYKKMLDMGIVDPKHALSPLDEANADWDSLSPGMKDTMDLKMAIYAAMIDIMDQGIGQIVKTLEEKGKLDNTLIVFLSDNGASYEQGPLGHNFRPDLAEAMGSENSYHSYGSSWANASNTPYRKFKRYTFEGGFATPMIARWGDQINNKNGLTTAVGHITDLMPTILEVSGASYPTELNGNAIHPYEGKSLLPILTGEKNQIRSEEDALIWEHEGNKAVRMGSWKLVKTRELPGWKLFDLEKDRTELNDLSDNQPEIKAHLLSKYEAWANRVGVEERGPDDQ